MSTQSLSEHADEQSRRPWFRFVARAGMAARGVIFPIIGVLAIRVATDSGGETTDQEGALSALAEQRFGGFLLALLTLGLAGYALWRFAQGLLDTDDKGDDEKAWAMRAGKLGSGVVHAILCVTALQILRGSGGGGSGSGDPKSTTAGVLGWPGGQVWVALVALAVVGVAAWNIYRGQFGAVGGTYPQAGTPKRPVDGGSPIRPVAVSSGFVSAPDGHVVAGRVWQIPTGGRSCVKERQPPARLACRRSKNPSRSGCPYRRPTTSGRNSESSRSLWTASTRPARSRHASALGGVDGRQDRGVRRGDHRTGPRCPHRLDDDRRPEARGCR